MIIESIRVIIGLVLILFIPGYAFTWAIYPRKENLTRGERIAISFPLSISEVMLSILFGDIVLGINTTPLNIVIIIFFITFLSISAWKIHLYVLKKELHLNNFFFINKKMIIKKLKQFREKQN